MSKVVAILATMDTKGAEAHFMREQIEAAGGGTYLIDIGVVGKATVDVEVSNEEVISAGGGSLAEVLASPTRQDVAPMLIAGATKILLDLIEEGRIHSVLSLGGSQGTSVCGLIVQALPYGFPKLMLSTCASGDTAPFVGIKDVTMMFSVSDILGLNPFAKKILANAAVAAFGMAQVEREISSKSKSGKPLIGMTNLGVLTNGAMHAIDLFHAKGYEVITFHAIGAGGAAMEMMMKEGIIGGVFDYALGEIADEVYHSLRAGNEERLTVAGKLGIPQVVCPCGAEHIGMLLHVANEVPEAWADHQYILHSPFVFAPRLKVGEIEQVAERICERLQHATKDTIFLMPLGGTSRYAIAGGELRDEESDAAFWQVLQDKMPDAVDLRTHEGGAEDDAFVETAVDALISMLEA